MQAAIIALAVLGVILWVLVAIGKAIFEWCVNLNEDFHKSQHEKNLKTWNALHTEHMSLTAQAKLEHEKKHQEWEKLVDEEHKLLNQPVREKFENDLNTWQHKVRSEKVNLQEIRDSRWKTADDSHEAEYNIASQKLEALEQFYFGFKREGVLAYNEAVLNFWDLPDGFPDEHELDYDEETKCLVLNFRLPAPENINRTKEWKYIKSKTEIRVIEISETVFNKIYDETIYKTALGAIRLIAESDDAGAIDYIAFNGWVKSLNKATGKEQKACIVSMYVSKSSLSDLDFNHLDAKECFRSLKGIGSTKLHTITPVPPIFKMNTTDKRFVDSYSVASDLDDSINLAAIDWEDFEHLVREIFEKEFAGNGGEVKVTQSSMDGGVDAVVFDPDPIRGGKIIIQAKRYTNIVGVSAVRDLHGTIQHEGAMKGILVTTSDFGPESHKFAMNKPITLINGAQLLYLLEKHGHKAKIDIKDAKRFFKEQMKG